jgi:hypothetical protein
MNSFFVGDMECPQEGSAVSGVVTWLMKGDHCFLSRY